MPDLTQCQFLVFPNYSQGMARAKQAATQLKCDIGTIYWWMVLKLTDGRGAVVIEPSGPYSTSATIGGVTYTMPQTEINRLVPWSSISAYVDATSYVFPTS